MMHRAWSSIVEVPYCFSRSYVKFQGHTALKIVKFDPNGAFPDSNSRLNLPMAMKCCTKLETAKERCPIVFQGHPSNFKVTRDKTSLILTQIGRFRTIGRSQLSNPSDLPCLLITRYCFTLCKALISPNSYLCIYNKNCRQANGDIRHIVPDVPTGLDRDIRDMPIACARTHPDANKHARHIPMYRPAYSAHANKCSQWLLEPWSISR